MKTITQLVLFSAFLFTGLLTFSQGTLQVSGNATVINSGDTTPSTTDDTDFGNVYIGFNNPNTFVLDNTASGGSAGNRLNGITVNITGTHAADFTPNSASLGNLRGNDPPINHVITFTPSGVGLRTATVTITFTNGTNSPYTYDIQGTGLTPAPEMDVTGLGVVIADNDATPSTVDDTDWGNINIGTPTVHTFTINNTGIANLNLTGLAPYIVVGGANAADFVVTAAPAPIIAPGGSTTFNITFTPGAVGLRVATLSLANDDTDENPYNFSIQGTGVVPSPEIDVTGLGVSIVDGDTTPSTTDDTDFGSTTVGVPIAKTFTIHNTGTATLNVGTVTITGAYASNFVVTTPPAATVAAGNTTTFTVTFTPILSGTLTATINITNDDLDENPYNYDIQGIGLNPPANYTAFYESFDATNGGWTIITSTNDTWVWTTTYPIAVLDGLAEGGFWRSSNFNNYANSTDIVVESPVYDFTGLTNLHLSLDVEYDTQNNVDGMRILYSIAGGPFTLLGASGSGTNWYDDNASVFGTDAWNDDSHPGTPSFSGRYSHFKFASLPLDDITFAGQNNVRFRIQFSSDSGTSDDGVAFDNFKIEADPIVALNDASVAPANITPNLKLWLKTNAGVAASDGAALTNWEDQAYDTFLDKEDATASSALAPTYRDNANRNINYNPVVDFDNSNTEYMNGKGGFYSQDYFAVVRSDDLVDTQTGTFSPGRQFPIGGRSDYTNFHEDPTGLAFGSSSARYVNEIIAHNMGAYAQSGSPGVDSYGRAYTSGSDSFYNVLILNVKANAGATSKEIYKNGKRIDNTTGTTGTSGTGTPLDYYEFDNLSYLVGMGRSGITGRTTSQLNGMLGEIISYNTPNSALNQQKIQSYLGIKYGVTLQDAASASTDYRLNDVDYIDSNGNVVWDTSVNSAYNYDIAGIGRDDNSQLNQKQSMSQNLETDGTGPTSGFLTMALTQIYNTNNENITNNTTTLNDGEFLMWGNNNVSLNGTALNVTVDMSEDIGDVSLVTDVTFTAIPRIWKVVETAGDIPSVEVAIPTSVVRTATPPDGRYLMFISATGIFDPTADYRVMTETGGMLYADYDFDGTEYITFGWAPEVVVERSIYFDPANGDYIDVEDHLDLNPTGFTMSAWIKPQANNGTITSKRNVAFTEGYDFRVRSNNRLWFRLFNGGIQGIQSTVDIPMDEWHHVAVIHDGTTATLYIDGVADTSAAMPAPIDTNQNFFIGAAGKAAPTDFFDGNIDEVRVWDTALTEDQLRYIMNQEIQDNTGFVSGAYFESRTVTPTKEDVATIPWTDLAGYYPMSTYTYTNTKDESGNGHQGALKNLKTVDWQTAPIPYLSTQNGSWDDNNSWENGDVQPIPGTSSIVNSNISIDWNIVQTSHNITIDDDSDLPAANLGNRSVLALFVDSGEILVDGNTGAGTGYGLTVTHYLNLDGDIDLEGESQLIQTLNSDLEVTSSGILERDQQGTADLYTYNYWAAPVGVSNITSNNNSYTLPDVMKDGTSNINFITSGYDGTATSPIGIADYWIWKFANQLDDDYSSWQHVRSTGTLLAGEGFTMKGPGTGPISSDQNYVFNGKPHNGSINLTLSAGNDYLVGNPYASAIDAEQFILDNGPLVSGTGATTGTLHFWEHWGGGSHNLSEYLGGYATYNLSGGTPSASMGTNDPDVGTGGTPTKTPGRYIPVGQGFFVVAESTGTINFNNGQRVFQRESVNSVFMEANNPDTDITPGKASDLRNMPPPPPDARRQLRIGFYSVNTIRRQLLLTIDENATENIDWGYDGQLYESQIDDLYWMIDNEKYIIQGSDQLDDQTVFPLGIKTDSDGMNVITIDEMTNTLLTDDLELYVHDKELDLYHDLLAGDYEFFKIAGESNDRFEITFSPGALSLDDNAIETLDVYYSNDLESIVLVNPLRKNIKSIELLNVLGQTIYSIKTIGNSAYAEYEVSNLSTGTYVLQLHTENGILSKKVLVE